MADEASLPSAGITSAVCGPSSADLPLPLHPSRLVGLSLTVAVEQSRSFIRRSLLVDVWTALPPCALLAGPPLL